MADDKIFVSDCTTVDERSQLEFDPMVNLLRDGLARGLSLQDVPRDRYGCRYGCMRRLGAGHPENADCAKAIAAVRKGTRQ